MRGLDLADAADRREESDVVCEVYEMVTAVVEGSGDKSGSTPTRLRCSPVLIHPVPIAHDLELLEGELGKVS
jgi:hypothetical protein